MARILVVEDEPMVRDLVMTYLRMAGFEVIAAADGIEALRLAHSGQPDLVLMDMGLPKLNGWQTTHRLRSNPETAHLPIVALTAYALDEDRQRALNVGCNAFLAKPIDFPALLETIQSLINQQDHGHAR